MTSRTKTASSSSSSSSYYYYYYYYDNYYYYYYSQVAGAYPRVAGEAHAREHAHAH